MIRNPIHSALGRGRPELSRLSEGIAASLRQFSVAQARCSDDQPIRPTSRQRSAAAAKELLSMNGDQRRPQSSKSDAPGGSGTPPADKKPNFPRVISLSSLRGGNQGRFAGPKTGGLEGGNNFIKKSFNRDGPPPAGNVIRGGFRGRGGRGGSFGAARGGGSFAGRREGGGGAAEGRGGSWGASGGRGRGRRGRGGGEDERPGRRRNQRANDDAKEKSQINVRALAGYMRSQATGVAQVWEPTAPNDLLKELTGYTPVLPLKPTPHAHAATSMYHARILGSGRAYHPDDWMLPREAKERYEKGPGVFFPVAKAKTWTEKITKTKFKPSPKETNDAVAEAALVGKYPELKFTQLSDSAGMIRNYTTRDGTWNAAAGRTVEAKLMSLLPGAAKGGAAAAQPKAKTA